MPPCLSWISLFKPNPLTLDCVSPTTAWGHLFLILLGSQHTTDFLIGPRGLNPSLGSTSDPEAKTQLQALQQGGKGWACSGGLRIPRAGPCPSSEVQRPGTSPYWCTKPAQFMRLSVALSRRQILLMPALKRQPGQFLCQSHPDLGSQSQTSTDYIVRTILKHKQ